MDENIDPVVKKPGMWAILDAKVVTFRFWAPYADKVYVTGTFNGWSVTTTSAKIVRIAKSAILTPASSVTY